MGLEKRVKIQQIINNQLPSFVVDESPNAAEFLKQYYISQEYQGGPIDISDNLDQYLKLDNLISEVLVDAAKVTAVVETTDTTIHVTSTKGFPKEYGLVKIGNEVITYTEKTSTSFIGCIRGFSGITDYHNDLNQEELVFSSTAKEKHELNTPIENLSSLFLREFFKKFKSTFLPGFEELTFAPGLDVGNFIKDANSFYQSKGTEESFKILFNVLFGEKSEVLNLEQYLIKASSSKYDRAENIIIDILSPSTIKVLDVQSLVGKTIFKSTDPNTSAVISSVESFLKREKTYYKIGLFTGYGDISTIIGNFVVTPSTKNISAVSTTDNIITVDSTIGFPSSGVLISHGNSGIKYSSKSLNQFIGCENIESNIPINGTITSNQTYYAYDNNSNKIEFRILGTIRNFIKTTDSLKVDEGDIIYANDLGDNIENTGKSFKEIFANSWIYNTSARHQIQEIVNSSTFKLGGLIDRSSLKVGDKIDIVERGGQYLINTNDELIVTSIDKSLNQVVLSGLSNSVSIASTQYDIRKKINYSSTSSNLSLSIEYENAITSDVQNLYTDGDSYAYVASNSLPSKSVSGITSSTYGYDISKEINFKSLKISDSNFSNHLIDGTNTLSGISYTTIVSSSNVPFVTGDEIHYQSSGNVLVGLETGKYFIKVLEEKNKFKLYHSRAFIDIDEPVGIFTDGIVGLTTHNFTLYAHKDSKIIPQKLFKKLPLQKNIVDKSSVTDPGTVGILINGVEISNYKSEDKIYYGPIDKVELLNGGKDYDVTNPPLIEVSSGIGTTALIQPVISGKIEEVLVDQQDYDIEKIVSISISGGNGSDGDLEPVLTKRSRQVSFDGRRNSLGGGIYTTTDRIVCLTDHNFLDGEEVIYNSSGNESLLIGSGTETLSNNTSYFVKVINNKTISLFNTKDDFVNGSNQIGFSTGTEGIHKFSTTDSKKTISSVNVLNGGKYTNRNLKFKYSDVDTTQNTIIVKDHGFKTGELVTYSAESANTAISSLNEANSYFILRVDDDGFRLCDAGIGATITSNLDRQLYVKIESQTNMSGYHSISYPPVSVSIKYQPVGFGTDTQTYEEIIATPVIKGEIVDLYLYEKGTGYGTTILNYDKSPVVSIKNGKNASLIPNIVNGKIDSVNIEYSGDEYYSVPNLEVVDSGTLGSGAKLRAVISNGKITDVKVLNGGIGYSNASTISVTSSGSGASIKTKVRSLTVDDTKRFESEKYLSRDSGLQYTVSGYFEKIRNSFGEDSGRSSEIIGWAYDGNPIYGPYGNSDPLVNDSSSPRIMTSGYVLDTSNVSDRPSGFVDGFFVEDYKFNASGDLDEYNGRFSVTKEFPNGIYAYYATINEGTPSFPYFIGNKYKSKLLEENKILNQEYDFSSTNILRNTYPYKISDSNSDYEFIPKIDNIKQKIKIGSVSRGEVEKLSIISSGDNYKVDDLVLFESLPSDGSGLSASVSKIKGKDIQEINATVESYNAEISWLNPKQLKFNIVPNHNLLDNDYVYISGISSDSLIDLNLSTKKISVGSSIVSSCISTVTSSPSLDTKEIYLSYIPKNISIGSSIKIEDEILKVLGIYESENILRVERGSIGVAHSENTPVYFLNDSFIVDFSSEYLISDTNKKVFFNPQESIGFGIAAGIGSSKEVTFGNQTIVKNIPTQTIEIPNHPFTNNQKIKFFVPDGGLNIGVSTDGGVTSQFLPEDVYVVNKGKNFIGLKTELSSENSLFFVSCDTNSDLYRFETTYSPITATVSKNIARVSVSTSHNLNVGDRVELNVQPNLNVGIGTSTHVRIAGILNGPRYVYGDTERVSISSVDVNNNTITTKNNFNTGDKVLYGDVPLIDSADEGSITGLVKDNFYFVFKVSDDTFKLCETYNDSVKNPPLTIDFTAVSDSTDVFALYNVNPRIKVTKGNNLILVPSNIKIFTDNEFKNEFVSTGSTTNFNVVSTGSSIILNYSEDLPTKLYYDTVSQYNGGPDKEVKNYNEILYVDSVYNTETSVVSVGDTYFDLVLTDVPERLSYNQSECTSLVYSTDSKNAQGPIDNIRIISKGNYKKLPKFSTITSTLGKDAYISAESSVIGNINNIEILSNEFEYSSDITLKPQSYISPLITLDNSNTIDSVSVVNGGSSYTKEPDLIIVDSISGKKINSGLLKANLNNASISTVDILEKPTGIPDDSAKIFAINNTNGISISKVESDSTGIFTCFITTPSGENGFSVSPFNINGGDIVYIEGIIKDGEDGSGFNSEDYGYKFFVTKEYIKQSGANDKVVIDLSDSSNLNLSSNTGIAKTTENIFGTIILKDDYPSFTISQSRSLFENGEFVTINGSDSDIKIVESRESTIKIFGFSNIQEGDVLVGKNSGTVATISKIHRNSGLFSVEYSSPVENGWKDGIGKLSSDYQKIADNDYYQNLSYSVKSSISYEKSKPVVDSILHTSGLKNFADMQIQEVVSDVGIKTNGGKDESVNLHTLVSEERVDSINDFDLVRDLDNTSEKSRFLEFKNRRLSNFAECTGNRVLAIDDLQPLFSNFESDTVEYKTILELSDTVSFDNYLVKITSTDESHQQLSEFVILNDSDNRIIVNRGFVTNDLSDTYDPNTYGTFEINSDDDNKNYLRFYPTDAYDYDYDLKLIRSRFVSMGAGIGTISVGFVDVTSTNSIVSAGTTNSLVEFDSSDFKSMYANVQIIDTTTNEMNFVELYLSHDGTNTFISENYFDTIESQLSSNVIGIFTGSDLSNNKFGLKYINDTENSNTVRAKIIGFGPVSGGAGTYRFKSSSQTDGTERSVIYSSNSSSATGDSVIASFDANLFDCSKSIVEITIGSIRAVHQVMSTWNSSDSFVKQSTFLSHGADGNDDPFNDISGIGTFGGNINGSNYELKFYPDPDFSAPTLNFSVFNQVFYKTFDEDNTPLDLEYGTISENISLSKYNAINGERINRKAFELTSNNVPIFIKGFDPSNTSTLNTTTGEFTIEDHFFYTGQELKYTPKTSVINVTPSAMTYYSGGSNVTLPSTVFAIRQTNDSFYVATTYDNATLGIAVTTLGVGVGNTHEFEAIKKEEKVIISIDNIVQYPLIDTNLVFDLSQSIGSGTTFISLSGINSIRPNDVLSIENEYLKVINVGLGEQNTGPIVGSGSFNLVNVERGVLGTDADSHSNSGSDHVRIYRGSFNIQGNTIHFTDAPRGNPELVTNKSNSDYETSDFNGRVFLKSNYDSNKIFDDISEQFTGDVGTGRTFTLTVAGLNTSGIGTEGKNGIVFINGVYQSPTTENNPNGNYEIVETEASGSDPGITSIIFSAITIPETLPVTYHSSEYDVNQNELPRGGLIVSLGSTPGSGYAPLVGASVTAIVTGGVIQSVGVGTTDNFGSGYNGLVSIGVTVFEAGHTGTAASVRALVGLGGTLSFTVDDGGTNYNNPQIFVSPPSYENLSPVGISRIGIGDTTETGSGLLVDAKIGPISVATGAGSTLYEVSEFKISRQGFNFRKGDKFTLAGLVTARGLDEPINPFELEVLEVYNDSFASWNFGNLDYIDSIKSFQDGERTKFTLRYDGSLLSFESVEGSDVDFAQILLVFVNGILQKPTETYEFTGGTTINFKTAPKIDDSVNIYFYLGVDGVDVNKDVSVRETIEVGDNIQVTNNKYVSPSYSQEERTNYSITASDIIETNLYLGEGIIVNDEYKPLKWIKQKSDKVLNGENVSKNRVSLEPLIIPTSNIIKDVGIGNTNLIFIDNAESFKYDNLSKFTCTIINPLVGVHHVSEFDSVVGSSGTITEITVSTFDSQPCLQFTLQDAGNALQVGFPIYIFNTQLGVNNQYSNVYNGVTTKDDDGNTIGVGVSFLDNIYYVSAYDSTTGIITCKVDTAGQTAISGISASGIVGNYSWGYVINTSKNLSFTNSDDVIISGMEVNTSEQNIGLSTHPVLMRKTGGFRGGLKRQILS